MSDQSKASNIAVKVIPTETIKKQNIWLYHSKILAIPWTDMVILMK